MSAPKPNILLVEDELHLHEALKLNLEMEGYEVTSAFEGPKALNQIQHSHFDLIILDVMLPGLDGFSIIETVRLNNIETPILVLSAKNTSMNRVQGLKLGADDYLTKPFNLEELLLRVGKLIQKSTTTNIPIASLDQYTFGGNTVYFKLLQANPHQGETIQLTKKEAMLLKLLIENKNTIITRERILQTVWGYNVFPNTRTIDNFILNFRKYFEQDPKNPVHFISIRGVGYKFQD
jgi:two-component system alkaline phosphatase synthesis response regulator PhoP